MLKNTILLALFPVFLMAQKHNFKKGYVILNNLQQVNGKIDYGYWLENPTMINFQDESGKITSYTPNDIVVFKIEKPFEQVYRSYTVDLNTSTNKIEQLEYSKDPKLVSSRVFLNVLIDGDIRLLSHFNPINEYTYYVQKGNGKPELLIYKRYFITTHEFKTNEQYRIQLDSILRDRVKDANYSRVSYIYSHIAKLISQYNGTSNKLYETNFNKKFSSFGVKLGASKGNMDIETVRSLPYPMSTSWQPSLGLSYYFTLSAFKRKASLGIESYFNSLKYASSPIFGDTAVNTIKQNNLKLVLNIHYNFLLDRKFIPFVNLGVFNNIQLSSSYNTSKYFNYAVFYNKTGVKTLGNGFNVGMGFSFNRYSLEGRYEQGQMFQTNTVEKSKGKFTTILFGVKF